MAPDRTRAETQPVLQAPAADLGLPYPARRSSRHRRRHAPRPSAPPVPGSAPTGIARPGPRTARKPARAGS